MKLKILKTICSIFIILIFLFQSCNLAVFANDEELVENQIEEEIEKENTSFENNDEQDNSSENEENIEQQENTKEKDITKDNNLQENNIQEDKSKQGTSVEQDNESLEETMEKETIVEQDNESLEETMKKETDIEQNNKLQEEIIQEKKNDFKQNGISKMSLNAPTTITRTQFFEESILDTLKLDLVNMPTVTVENKGNHIWNEVVGTHPANPESKYQHKMLYFNSKLYDQNLSEVITVVYNNAGTLNGKPIDMKLVYSDLHTTSDTNEIRDFFLSWCAYGKVETRTVKDEFFNIGFDRFNLDISFYYQGSKTPIELSNAYFTVSSLDKENNHIEGTNSNFATNAYYYENTAIVKSSQETIGGKTYTNVFKGTINEYAAKETRSAVCFQYKNISHINFNMFSLGTAPVSFGYHVNFYSLNASISKPQKSVNKTEAFPGDTLIYTIKQKMPYINNDNFEFNSFEFKDVLSECFDFQTVNLQVKDNNERDVTNSAGRFYFENGEVKYIFNKTYLQSKKWKGEEYTFLISAKIKDDISDYIKYKNSIDNYSTTIMNKEPSGTLNSNTVKTDLYFKVNTKAQNGTIDEKKEKVKAGSDITVNFTPNHGYTLKSLTVNGEKQDISNNPSSFSIKGIDKNYDIQVVFEKIQGTAKIIKIGENNKTLEGAKFNIVAKEDIYLGTTLVYAKGTTIEEKSTNSEGKIEFNNLCVGKYQIFETEAPKGYEKLKYSIEFEVTEKENSHEFTVKNILKPILPKTGGYGIYLYLVDEIILITGSAFLYKKNKNK